MDRCPVNQYGKHDNIIIVAHDGDDTPVGLHCRECEKILEFAKSDTPAALFVGIRMGDCNKCGHNYAMHSGGNICPQCGESEFAPIAEA